MNGLISSSVYHREIAILKRYGQEYKLTLHRILREGGWEENKPKKRIYRLVATEKMTESIRRAKSRIMELGLCNPWQFFFTGTLDPKKYDRENLGRFQKDLSQFIRDQRKKYGCELKYLIIPELHTDGKSWHVHGLLNGLSEEMIREFEPEEAPWKVIVAGYLNYPDYSKKFGYVTLGHIRNHSGVSRYITKYVTKDTTRSVKELYKKMYYCSQGLNRAQIIKKGALCTAPASWDYENDHVKVAWIGLEELNKYL